jgi:murein DD-endopeptidase MepM/ murein hydrolase activator NlpD
MSGRAWLGLLLVAALVAAGVFVWRRAEGSAPQVAAPESIVVGAQGGSVALEVTDRGTGLRSVAVVFVHAQGEQTLLAEEYPGSALAGALSGEAPVALEVTLDVAALPRQVKDGFLRISARDWSWRGGLAGNETRLDVPVAVDRDPPRVSIATGLTYVRRGGAGAVVYSLSEPSVRDGVQVADAFYPGFPLGQQRVALYAVPTDAPANPSIRVLAEDEAGNVARARWPVVVNERALPEASVTLPQRFLESRVEPLARAQGIEVDDLERAFERINTQVRSSNEQRIREVVADTVPEPLWEGPFQQLQNSKVTSRFAEKRSYFVAGKALSQATHFGYDLASTAAAPVGAAAAGRVVFADDLGIYGNCVLLDHGLGVSSLYGHLSRIDVAPGDRVEQGQTLGLSGATGLAGGDHLHFAILVGGTYVDPLEWWDPKWVRSNIEDRLAAAGP